MPFNEYSDLLKAVERWLVRPDLVEDIPDFVWLGEIRIQQDLDLPMIETETTGNLSTTDEYISLPADCVELKFFGVPGTNPPVSTKPVSQDIFQAVSYKNQSGTIIVSQVRGSRLYLAGAPTEASEYTLTYLAGITHLSTSNTSNALLTYDPNLLLYASLLDSAPFIGDDERIPTWLGLYEDRKKAKKKQIFRHRAGAGPLMRTPDQSTP